ncbi:MAG: hypothetical protein K8W52_13905 [Deltaproteobacteria bacterium]|nr:hypothetical protein [Deltaproteobacteria bacterium]
MTRAPLVLAALVPLAFAAPAFADPTVGAHVECFHGTERVPIQKRRALSKPIVCAIKIDQGEPAPSAKAQLVIVQDGSPHKSTVTNSDQFVPEDVGDGIYYPFPTLLRAGVDYRACKDFTVLGRILDGTAEVWRGGATIQPKCRAARKLPLVGSCHWDTPTTGTGAAPELVCVVQTKNLKTKVPAYTAWLKVHGTDHQKVDTFGDYPDDTFAVEARFAASDASCGGTIDAVAENPLGQAVWSASIAVPCPAGATSDMAPKATP